MERPPVRGCQPGPASELQSYVIRSLPPPRKQPGVFKGRPVNKSMVSSVLPCPTHGGFYLSAGTGCKWREEISKLSRGPSFYCPCQTGLYVLRPCPSPVAWLAAVRSRSGNTGPWLGPGIRMREGSEYHHTGFKT